MFGNQARPKACFTLWLGLQQRLLTADRLLKWGLEATKICVLCNRVPENHEHLFVLCPVARTLWARILTWSNKGMFNVVHWEDFMKWSVASSKGKGQQAQICKMIINAEVLHTLWRERNQRIFEKKSVTVERLAKDLAYVCTVRAPTGSQVLVQNFSF
ncbi:uncharacterized protein LOC132608128 [Lycium barbarum]|uniref:uncharacterized protein LOC132608128 n=1 Tax=Lycium barbarum TaxID=112863 RepID=UPI00293EF4A4|nr:uncharacterized protein LOC132608128 [Lycium barbarum]